MTKLCCIISISMLATHYCGWMLEELLHTSRNVSQAKGSHFNVLMCISNWWTNSGLNSNPGRVGITHFLRTVVDAQRDVGYRVILSWYENLRCVWFDQAVKITLNLKYWIENSLVLLSKGRKSFFPECILIDAKKTSSAAWIHPAQNARNFEPGMNSNEKFSKLFCYRNSFILLKFD